MGIATRLHRAVIARRQDAWDRSRSLPDHCHGQRLRRPGGQQPIIQSQHSRCLHAFAPYRAARRTGADHQRSAGTSGRLCRPGRWHGGIAAGLQEHPGRQRRHRGGARGLQRAGDRTLGRPGGPVGRGPRLQASTPATPPPSRKRSWACTTTASTSSSRTARQSGLLVMNHEYVDDGLLHKDGTRHLVGREGAQGAGCARRVGVRGGAEGRTLGGGEAVTLGAAHHCAHADRRVRGRPQATR
jgi:hypothetical protein